MNCFPTDLDEDWDWIETEQKWRKIMTGQIERETFESGAVRDKTDYRYDLCSPVVFAYVKAHTQGIITTILAGKYYDALELLDNSGYVRFPEIIHLYAQALHKGAEKYGERNWEKGIPESNLKNHAIHHLVKWDCGDTSEPHLSHAIRNIITLIHFYNTKPHEKYI